MPADVTLPLVKTKFLTAKLILAIFMPLAILACVWTEGQARTYSIITLILAVATFIGLLAVGNQRVIGQLWIGATTVRLQMNGQSQHAFLLADLTRIKLLYAGYQHQLIRSRKGSYKSNGGNNTISFRNGKDKYEFQFHLQQNNLAPLNAVFNAWRHHGIPLRIIDSDLCEVVTLT